MTVAATNWVGASGAVMAGLTRPATHLISSICVTVAMMNVTPRPQTHPQSIDITALMTVATQVAPGIGRLVLRKRAAESLTIHRPSHQKGVR